MLSEYDWKAVGLTRWLSAEFLIAAVAALAFALAVSKSIGLGVAAALPAAALGGRLATPPYWFLPSPGDQPTPAASFRARLAYDGIFVGLLLAAWGLAGFAAKSPVLASAVLSTWLFWAVLEGLEPLYHSYRRSRDPNWQPAMAPLHLSPRVVRIAVAVLALFWAVFWTTVPLTGLQGSQAALPPDVYAIPGALLVVLLVGTVAAVRAAGRKEARPD